LGIYRHGNISFLYCESNQEKVERKLVDFHVIIRMQ